MLRTSLGTREVRAGDAVYLYWESYGATAGDSAQVSLSMARTGVGLLERAAARVRLAPRPRPVRMRWNETGADGAGRSLALRIPDLPAGTYRIELAVDGAVTGTTVRVTR